MIENALCVQLHAVVSRLAAPATEQIEYLHRIGTFPSADELALDLYDLTKMSSRLRQDCQLSDEATTLIDALDKRLDRFSGQSQSAEWNASALHDSENWAEVRALAKRVLEVIS